MPDSSPLLRIVADQAELGGLPGARKVQQAPRHVVCFLRNHPATEKIYTLIDEELKLGGFVV